MSYDVTVLDHFGCVRPRWFRIKWALKRSFQGGYVHTHIRILGGKRGVMAMRGKRTNNAESLKNNRKRVFTTVNSTN